MRPGWRPERRNRKIGTKFSGFKARNAFDIPNTYTRSKSGSLCLAYYEQINPKSTRLIKIHDRDVRFFWEQPKPDHGYGCSISDVAHVLALFPEEDILLLDSILFRQPTRKQNTFSSAWGRLIYFASLDGHESPAIIIEAQDYSKPIKWKRSLNPELASELQRLRQDGHRIEDAKRHFLIHVTPDSHRNTVLYRTIAHEVGHYVDWMNSESDEYFTSPRRQKEDFAHRYATEMREKLEAEGKIPFAKWINCRGFR